MNIGIKAFSAEEKIPVFSISEQEIGKNFINDDYLNFFLNNPNARGIIAIVNEEIVGFSFFQWCTTDELSKYIFTDKNWLRKTVNEKNPGSKSLDFIGYRNLTAVKKNFQNKGVGSRLVEFSVNELKKKSDIIFNVVWKAENKLNLGNALKKNGLRPVKTITGYWKKDSIKRKYECAVCGLPPCKCTAEIYFSG